MCNFTSQQIQAVLQHPNEFPPKKLADMLMQNCFTIETLLERGLNAHQAELLKSQLQTFYEERDYNACTTGSLKETYTAMKAFIDNYPNSVHAAEIKAKMLLRDEEERQFSTLKERMKDLSIDVTRKLELIDEFQNRYPFGMYVNDLPQLRKNVEASEADHLAWRRIQTLYKTPGYNDWTELLNQIAMYDSMYNLHHDESIALKECIIKGKAEEADQQAWQKIMELSNTVGFNRWNDLLNMIAEYETNYTLHKEECSGLKEVIQRKRQQESQMLDEQAWQMLKSLCTNPAYENNPNYLLSQISNYQNQFALHLNEVPQLIAEVRSNQTAMPHIQSVLNDPISDVIDFLHLIQKYPAKKQFLREFMLKDMHINPSRYDRVEMNWLLKGKYDDLDSIEPIFTFDELVSAHVAPMEVINHIQTYPKDEDDRDPNENLLKPEENFQSAINNTDVYFFGVPGSGKSAVLAGLFNISTIDNFRFSLLMHGGHIGYTYASILKNYLTKKLFPQSTKTRIVRTQGLESSINQNPFATYETTTTPVEVQGEEMNSDKFIQIIDAELYESNKKNDSEQVHRLSIIEMPGERTLDFAAAPPTDPTMMDKLLGSGTFELFMNNNRKIFFIVIDPKPQRLYHVELNGVDTPVTQADALEALVYFFSKVPDLLTKVDAIHVILTKSDVLKNADDINCIQNDVINRGYERVTQAIKAICKPQFGNINYQCDHTPHLFTFSLGKVYPGHMIEYNKEDAVKILKVIASNTYSTATAHPKWDSIVNWMNQ